MKKNMLRLTLFLFFLNLFPIAFQVSFNSGKVIDSFSLNDLLLASVIFDLGFYFFSLLVICFMLSLTALQITKVVLKNSSNIHQTKIDWFVLLFLQLQLMAINTLLYPFSVQTLPDFIAIGVLTLGVIASTVFIVKIFSLRAVIVSGSILLIVQLSTINYLSAANGQKPNVFIIGIDGLRPDIVAKYPQFMPFISNHVSTSNSFKAAYTSLPRTHASLVSVLSGDFPSVSGVNFNLISTPNDSKSDYLPFYLSKQGYSTLFGLNDRRFSNIDKTYGFDAVIGPKDGIVDFFMTLLYDNPIVNIARAFSWSKYVFPYVRSNRALPHSYLSHTFVDDLKNGLYALDNRKPVFSLIHFAEPHYPYNALTPDEKQLSDLNKEVSSLGNYMKSVQLVDNSIRELMSFLKKSGFLNNAHVFILSDHGESFESDFVNYTNELTGESYLAKGYGHGTSILALEQSNVVLSYQKYEQGEPQLGYKVNTSLVSVTAITDAIKRIINPEKTDALFGAMNEEKESNWIPLETGLWVPALMTNSLDDQKIFLESFSAYKITTDGHVVLKENKLTNLIQSKELGVFNGTKILYFPRINKSKANIPMIFNTKEKTYRSVDVETDQKPLSEFCRYFTTYDRKDIKEWC